MQKSCHFASKTVKTPQETIITLRIVITRVFMVLIPTRVSEAVENRQISRITMKMRHCTEGVSQRRVKDVQ